jgi:RHS repeat-associated protein
VAPTTFALTTGYGNATVSTFTREEKSYELTNHLGNVLTTVTDKKIAVVSGSNSSLIDHFTADIATAQDYYPFGMLMPGRTTTSTYRYGFNGQERSDEVAGAGNHTTAEFWEYDPRVGRRWNLDPRPSAGLSEYAAFNNNPLFFSDLLGDTTVIGAGGDQVVDIDGTSTQTKVPVQGSQLRSFTNFIGTFSATWTIDESGSAVFDGYKNDKNQTVEDAVKKLNDFASSWLGKYLLWGSRQYEESQKDPLGYNLKLGVVLLSGPTLAAAEPVLYSPGYNPSVTFSDAFEPALQVENSGMVVSEVVVNNKGVPYPQVEVDGFGIVPFPEGPYLPNNSSSLRSDFTTSFKEEFKQWWIKQGRTWPTAPEGSVINIHHIKPLSKGGTNAFGNLVPLIQPEEHQPFTNWWRGFP